VEPFASILSTNREAGTKYIKRQKIGSGSYGSAYLAERASDGKQFVAKIIDTGKMNEKDRRYAHSEIKCLQLCDHPNIIGFEEDYDEEGDNGKDRRILIIMEFAEGGDLGRHIKLRKESGTFLQEHEIAFLFIQTVLALHYIHSQRMLHRDIKAANVLLSAAGVAKLADFGFSNQYEGTVSASVGTTFCGTPYYLAPEVWCGKSYSKKADTWSLGVMLYELLALKRPFSADNMQNLMRKVLAGEYEPLAEHYSPEIKALVRALLTVNPAERPSMDQVLAMPYINEGLRVLRDGVIQNHLLVDPDRTRLINVIDEALRNAPTAAAVAAASAALARTPAVSVRKEGVVMKAGGGQSTSWKQKWLFLRDANLVISDTNEIERGRALPLTQVHSVQPESHRRFGRPNVFVINAMNDRQSWIGVETDEELRAWLAAIHQAMGQGDDAVEATVPA